jgi:hypothetical protein
MTLWGILWNKDNSYYFILEDASGCHWLQTWYVLVKWEENDKDNYKKFDWKVI